MDSNQPAWLLATVALCRTFNEGFLVKMPPPPAEKIRNFSAFER